MKEGEGERNGELDREGGGERGEGKGKERGERGRERREGRGGGRGEWGEGEGGKSKRVEVGPQNYTPTSYSHRCRCNEVIELSLRPPKVVMSHFECL